MGEGEGILHDYYKENIIKRNHQKAATGFMSTKNSKKTQGNLSVHVGSWMHKLMLHIIMMKYKNILCFSDPGTGVLWTWVT